MNLLSRVGDGHLGKIWDVLVCRRSEQQQRKELNPPLHSGFNAAVWILWIPHCHPLPFCSWQMNVPFRRCLAFSPRHGVLHYYHFDLTQSMTFPNVDHGNLLLQYQLLNPILICHSLLVLSFSCLRFPVTARITVIAKISFAKLAKNTSSKWRKRDICTFSMRTRKQAILVSLLRKNRWSFIRLPCQFDKCI